MASMFSYHAIKYRVNQNLPLKNIKGAAIVQKMIDSQIAGVMFTAHPTTGCRNSILVSSTYGQGEGLVSGHCNADEFTIDYSTNEIESVIAKKDVKLVFDTGKGYGTREKEVASNIQEIPSLSQDLIIKIKELGVVISAQKGSPQDIEWCVLEGEIYLLQTRPITHLPAPSSPKGHHIVWDNSNIQESYCGVTTPLTFSFANRAYKSVYTQTLRILGTDESIIRSKEKALSNMLGLVKGRVYYNINNWYEGLNLLPSFQTNKEDMEKMMGLQDPVDFVTDSKLTFIEKLKKLPSMILLLISFLRNFSRIDNLVQDFLDHFKNEYNKIDRPNLHRLEVSQLLDLASDLSLNLLGKWHTPIINDFFVMMMNGKVGRHLKKAGFENPDLIQNNLMSGEPDVESTEPTKFLIGLAEVIKNNHEYKKLFSNYEDHELWEVVRAQAPKIFSQCEIYIEKYGDRCMGELKLESISLRQDPAFIFSILRNFVAKDDLSLEKIEANEIRVRQESEKSTFTLIKKKRGYLALRAFKRDLIKLRKAVKYRENMRFSRTRSFGIFRDIYTEIGEQLSFYGLIENPRDVFYLTVEELDAYHEGRSVQTNLKPICSSRREEWEAFEDVEVPHHFSTKGVVYYHNTYEYQGDNDGSAEPVDGVLKGTGCYPGVVNQKVRKIFSPKDELNLDGRILCTVRTDPGWTPLFPSASGILVERGSTLSHSAVIARELGIPAIVGIPGLTEHIDDGQVVRMDGTKGTISIQDEEES